MFTTVTSCLSPVFSSSRMLSHPCTPHPVRLGGGCMGVCDNILDEYNTGLMEIVAVVNMLHMLSYGQQGGGGWGRVIRFLASITRGAVVNMLHMLSYGQQGGGWCMGVCDNVLDEYNTGPTELVVVVNMLHMFSYGQQGGGGWGRVITFLASITRGTRNLLPLLTCRTCSLLVNRGRGGGTREKHVLCGARSFPSKNSKFG